MWIEFQDDVNPIESWYCQCEPAARTVGCSAHIVAVIWYLA